MYACKKLMASFIKTFVFYIFFIFFLFFPKTKTVTNNARYKTIFTFTSHNNFLSNQKQILIGYKIKIFIEHDNISSKTDL